VCMPRSPPSPSTNPPSLTCARSAMMRRADTVSAACRHAHHLSIPSPPSKNCAIIVLSLSKGGEATRDHHRPCITTVHKLFAMRRRRTSSDEGSVWVSVGGDLATSASTSGSSAEGRCLVYWSHGVVEPERPCVMPTCTGVHHLTSSRCVIVRMANRPYA
jgi:hypothetical protein